MNILLLNPKSNIHQYSKYKITTKRISLVNIVTQELSRGGYVNLIYDEVYLDFLPKVLYSLSNEQLKFLKLFRNADWSRKDFEYIYYP